MNKEKIYKSFDIAFNDYLSNEKSKSNHWIAQNKNFLKKIKTIKNPYGDGNSAKKILNVLKKINLKLTTQKINTY